MDDGAGDYFYGSAESEQEVKELERIERLIERRQLTRCNSTSTIKVGTTMAKPNHDAIIQVISHLIFGMIETRTKKFRGNGRRLPREAGSANLNHFNDPVYKSAFLCCYTDSDSSGEDDEQKEEPNPASPVKSVRRSRFGRNAKVDKENQIQRSNRAGRLGGRVIGVLNDLSSSRRRDKQSVEKKTQKKKKNMLPLPPVVEPTTASIRDYLKNMFVTAQCSEECNIICLIYIKRLLKNAGSRNVLTAYNWKGIVMTALLLASKVWDDLSMVNEDFAYFMPYNLDQVNEWEVVFLAGLGYNVRVSASEYARIYFDLRNQAQRAGLEALPDKEIDVEQAHKLEALTSTMEKRTKSMHRFCSEPAPVSPDQWSANKSPNGEGRRLRRTRSDYLMSPTLCRYVID
mmetsp:Transcript_334/g.618  ORF Transcript_334/g.618 Transcript_334/m.618 type:complete len:401 (-) Transcript_334:1324-2526(-)